MGSKGANRLREGNMDREAQYLSWPEVLKTSPLEAEYTGAIDPLLKTTINYSVDGRVHIQEPASQIDLECCLATGLEFQKKAP
jgi:hypothetical protein